MLLLYRVDTALVWDSSLETSPAFSVRRAPHQTFCLCYSPIQEVQVFIRCAAHIAMLGQPGEGGQAGLKSHQGCSPWSLGLKLPLYKLPFTEEYFLLFLPCLELCKDNLRDGCIFLRWWKENTMSISLWKKEMQNICLTIKTAKEFSLNHNS